MCIHYRIAILGFCPTLPTYLAVACADLDRTAGPGRWGVEVPTVQYMYCTVWYVIGVSRTQMTDHRMMHDLVAFSAVAASSAPSGVGVRRRGLVRWSSV